MMILDLSWNSKEIIFYHTIIEKETEENLKIPKKNKWESHTHFMQYYGNKNTEEFINCDSNLWAVEIAVEFTERWKHIKHKKRTWNKKVFRFKKFGTLSKWILI